MTFDPSALSPGIRNAVVWLRERGWVTTDSGDGSNFDAGMEGALPFPHIAVQSHEDTLLNDGRHLLKLLTYAGAPASVTVECSFNPADRSAVILVSEAERGGWLSLIAARVD